MLPNEKKRLDRADVVYFVLISVILVMIAGVVFADIRATGEEADNIINQLEQSSKENAEIVFTAATQLTLIRNYTQSADSYVTSQPLDQTLVGKSIDAVKEAYASWEVVSYDEKEITLKCSIDSFGPDFYKITTGKKGNDEIVVVYKSDLDGKESIHLETNCYLNLLDETQQQALRKGILVKGEEELAKYMENYIE